MSADPVVKVSSNKCFGGLQEVYSHESLVLKCSMKFAIYLPPAATTNNKCPVVYWLSGLTCNEQNFITKSGAQRVAAELGLIIVCPDTSPRGCNIPGEDDSYDFGSGAGFYVDATEQPWEENYQMYSYVTKELPRLIETNFPVVLVNAKSIMGHSMGGHGALVCAFKNPQEYRSVSAFSPICHPTASPWGQKAFQGYLGSNSGSLAQSYDAVEILKASSQPVMASSTILVDQGADDEFLGKGQLKPEDLQQACASNGQLLTLRMQDGYDHSYYFIASFIEDHLRHHAKYLL